LSPLYSAAGLAPVAPALAPPVAEILGTRIFPLDLSGDPELRLISDLHLHPAEPAEFEAFAEWLRHVPDGAPALILGDLFEFWTGPKQCRAREWQPVLEGLRESSRRGVRSWVLHGNRDFLLDASFEKQTGARVVPGGLLVERPGGESLLLLHGDELCLNDLEYQRSKKLLRSRRIRLPQPHPAVSLRQADRRRAAHAQPGCDRSAADGRDAPFDPGLCRAGATGLFDADLRPRASGGPLSLARDPRGRSYHVLPAFTARRPGFVRQKGAGPLQLLEGGRELDWPEDSELGA
jgi:hypothetical protein